MSTVTLGGERLGSGKKQKVHLRNYERSTHDLGFVWRSTMASGTLVPFMSEVALPGDTFEINLETDIKTHPTIGPLFGSYKVQLDVFQVPIRLYQGLIHMNKLGIGMKMSNVKLPLVQIFGKKLNLGKPLDNQQINPSSIFSYLGISGLGYFENNQKTVFRDFNAVPWLAYWDIYKNYYANKQEEQGAVIHNDLIVISDEISVRLNHVNYGIGGPETITLTETNGTFTETELLQGTTTITIGLTNIEEFHNFDLSRVQLYFKGYQDGNLQTPSLDLLFNDWVYNEAELTITGSVINGQYVSSHLVNGNAPGFFSWWIDGYKVDKIPSVENQVEPKVKFFPLQNIDRMKEHIFKNTSEAFPIYTNHFAVEPYSLPHKFHQLNESEILYSILSAQEGLALKTYQSDLFNNWISTEWIDGENGINEITKIDTSDGNFTIDELNLSRKIYDMLNRIAVSGGTYDDWLDATYTHERTRSIDTPVYHGGLIKELTFQEVISNAESADQPLGTLAGRGILTNKKKGGYIKIRVDEPSYIMGIISLTPRIDYSQGNKWDTNLKTMDDFHKPQLDEIGFQDLITDQMAWWDTRVETAPGLQKAFFKSAGKQPAWINYMTNYNQVKGNFAIQSDQMFMVLTRRYETAIDETGNPSIKDLTTYIDPSKFNHIFAYTRRDAQNFWAQIKCDIKARRKMSAKVIPNL